MRWARTWHTTTGVVTLLFGPRPRFRLRLVAGALSDRIGGRMLITAGIALQSIALVMLAALASPTVAYADLVVPFVIAGIGMGLFFAPVANVVLGSVRPEEKLLRDPSRSSRPDP